MARKKSLATKAKEIGIDLSKETIGSLVDRLHQSNNDLQVCQTGKTGVGKTENTEVSGVVRNTTKKVVKTSLNAAKKTKEAVKDVAKGTLDAVCNCK